MAREEIVNLQTTYDISIAVNSFQIYSVEIKENVNVH